MPSPASLVDQRVVDRQAPRGAIRQCDSDGYWVALHGGQIDVDCVNSQGIGAARARQPLQRAQDCIRGSTFDGNTLENCQAATGDKLVEERNGDVGLS